MPFSITSGIIKRILTMISFLAGGISETNIYEKKIPPNKSPIESTMYGLVIPFKSFLDRWANFFCPSANISPKFK